MGVSTNPGRISEIVLPESNSAYVSLPATVIGNLGGWISSWAQQVGWFRAAAPVHTVRPAGRVCKQGTRCPVRGSPLPEGQGEEEGEGEDREALNRRGEEEDVDEDEEKNESHNHVHDDKDDQQLQEMILIGLKVSKGREEKRQRDFCRR
ncbi:hypothetical protein F2P81_007454 [Scophthalmus maximus]|uniref:Uncharacterized protein n=1 Tax=Scophthalmus maximus TaxID=52904 RepID=A0A6A4T2Q7_SCOMX|nr:hypothetical protein F2P81_007454 [Scophthalmus maximus]